MIILVEKEPYNNEYFYTSLMIVRMGRKGFLYGNILNRFVLDIKSRILVE